MAFFTIGIVHIVWIIWYDKHTCFRLNKELWLRGHLNDSSSIYLTEKLSEKFVQCYCWLCFFSQLNLLCEPRKFILYGLPFHTQSFAWIEISSQLCYSFHAWANNQKVFQYRIWFVLYCWMKNSRKILLHARNFTIKDVHGEFIAGRWPGTRTVIAGRFKGCTFFIPVKIAVFILCTFGIICDWDISCIIIGFSFTCIFQR